MRLDILRVKSNNNTFEKSYVTFDRKTMPFPQKLALASRVLAPRVLTTPVAAVMTSKVTYNSISHGIQ